MLESNAVKVKSFIPPCVVTKAPQECGSAPKSKFTCWSSVKTQPTISASCNKDYQVSKNEETSSVSDITRWHNYLCK